MKLGPEVKVPDVWPQITRICLTVVARIFLGKRTDRKFKRKNGSCFSLKRGETLKLGPEVKVRGLPTNISEGLTVVALNFYEQIF